MENEIIYNENLYFEHKQWKSKQAFWEDELNSFTNRLEELVNRWTKKEVLIQLEHFQNEFILQDGSIDRLREEIEKHESRMAGQSLKGENAMDTVLTEGHLVFRNKMETQRHIHAKLKKKFFSFLSKYM